MLYTHNLTPRRAGRLIPAERYTMSYEKLFMKYGSPSREADIRITGYLIKPESMARFDDVKHWDGSAMRIISECEATISALQDYRKALAARYGALATMPSHGKLSLERDRGYHGITYYVRQFTVYEVPRKRTAQGYCTV